MRLVPEDAGPLQPRSGLERQWWPILRNRGPHVSAARQGGHRGRAGGKVKVRACGRQRGSGCGGAAGPHLRWNLPSGALAVGRSQGGIPWIVSEKQEGRRRGGVRAQWQVLLTWSKGPFGDQTGLSEHRFEFLAQMEASGSSGA